MRSRLHTPRDTKCSSTLDIAATRPIANKWASDSGISIVYSAGMKVAPNELNIERFQDQTVHIRDAALKHAFNMLPHPQ